MPITIKTIAANLLIVFLETLSEINFPKKIAIIERRANAIIAQIRTAKGLNLVAKRAAAI